MDDLPLVVLTGSNSITFWNVSLEHIEYKRKEIESIKNDISQIAVQRVTSIVAQTGLSKAYDYNPLSAISTAAIMLMALLTVSWYSASGTESATTPPPACA